MIVAPIQGTLSHGDPGNCSLLNFFIIIIKWMHLWKTQKRKEAQDEEKRDRKKV